MSRLLALALTSFGLLLLAFGCPSTGAKPPGDTDAGKTQPSPAPEATPESEKPAELDAHAMEVRKSGSEYEGYFGIDGEDKWFRMASSGEYVGFIDERGMLDHAWKQFNELPGEPLWAKVRGTLQPSDPAGPLAKYPQTLVVHLALSADVFASHADLFPRDFALETAGMWRLDIYTDRDVWVRDYTHKHFLRFPYAPPRIDGPTTIYEFPAPPGEPEVGTLKVTIKPGVCEQGTTSYLYEALAEYMGKQEQACAVAIQPPGSPAPATETPAGETAPASPGE